MELKAHFSNIHKVIIDHLEQAQSEIVAAIAWFTDRDIFEVLCKKARSGIKVSVALIGDEINQGPGRLNFHRLGNFGGQVTLEMELASIVSQILATQPEKIGFP